jgi:hypothetical protein
MTRLLDYPGTACAGRPVTRPAPGPAAAPAGQAAPGRARRPTRLGWGRLGAPTAAAAIQRAGNKSSLYFAARSVSQRLRFLTRARAGRPPGGRTAANDPTIVLDAPVCSTRLILRGIWKVHLLHILITVHIIAKEEPFHMAQDMLFPELLNSHFCC